MFFLSTSVKISSRLTSIRNLSSNLPKVVTSKMPSAIKSQEQEKATTRTEPRYFDKAFTFPPDQPVVYLNASTAFSKLTDKERLFAHYLSKASFYGGLVTLNQVSLESPQIFRLLQKIFLAQTPEELKVETLKENSKINEEDFEAFLIYSSGIFSSAGNYQNFGDAKFIPDLPQDKFEAIVKGSKAWKDDPTGMGKIWDSIKDRVWSLEDFEKQLGLGDKGVTKYFSSNCDSADAEKVSRYLKSIQYEAWMSRVIKTTNPTDGKPVYEIRSAAVEESSNGTLAEFEGAYFNLTAGDYSPVLKLVIQELEKAKKYAGNDLEKNMIDAYILCFQKGDVNDHKKGSRFWIENKSPNVEFYIGFIEVYRDPVGQRAEFEAFVSMVNKDQSIKFQKLVENAEKLLPLLPWPRSFEKDRFLKPDFTSLDVLTFSGSGIPKGINIPNYGEIRQSEGFKNVNLGNVVSSASKDGKTKANFVGQTDDELLKKFKISSFDVQVGLHELLGHGSGKLLVVDADGKPNYDVDKTINPLTEKPVDQKEVYQAGETFETKFSDFASSYEECRAETVGLYLSTNKDVLNIFEVPEADQSDTVYVNWFSLCLGGISGLEFYSPTSNEWKQAHSRARFAILQVLIETGQDFVNVSQVTGSDGKPDLLFTMDRTKLMTVGFPALEKFLRKLQVYKSTGDVESARKLYDHYSSVNDDDSNHPWLSWRAIAIERKKPRKMFVQANTVEKDGSINLLEYDESHEGFAHSARDRFTPEEYAVVDQALVELYEKDLPHFSKKN